MIRYVHILYYTVSPPSAQKKSSSNIGISKVHTYLNCSALCRTLKLGRLIGKNHTVKDGWFTLALSRVYSKPSALPDLRLVTAEIAWDDTWIDMETKVQKALR